MKTAARIAHTFGLDPVEVLRGETFEWHLRVAAARVIEADTRDAMPNSSS